MARSKAVIKFKNTEEEQAFLTEVMPAFTTELAKDAKVIGNFGEQKKFLLKRVSYVAGLDLEAKGIQHVETLKKAVRSWRTTFKKAFDLEVQQRFKDPQNVFKALGDEVFEQIAVAESKIDEILAREEKKRLEAVDKTLDGIEKDFREQYNLPAFAVEREKSYYNKTGKLSEIRKAIEELYKDEERRVKELEGNKKLVLKACEGVPELNTELYLNQLEYKTVFEVIEDVEAEIERLRAVKDETEEQPEEEDVQDEDTLTPVDTPVPTMMTKRLEIIYTKRQKALLSKLFTELKKNGVTVKEI